MSPASSVSPLTPAGSPAAEKPRRPETGRGANYGQRAEPGCLYPSGHRHACVLPAPAGFTGGQAPTAELPILHSVRQHYYCPHRTQNGSARVLTYPFSLLSVAAPGCLTHAEGAFRTAGTGGGRPGRQARAPAGRSVGGARSGDHAQRWRCIDIRAGCLPARPWSRLSTLRKPLITARRAA